MSRRTGRRPFQVAVALLWVACSPPEHQPLPPGSFAFGVFGDGPYRAWEMARFRRVIDDVNRADLQWFLHVGDILWFPCSNDEYARRLAAMSSVRHPVVYTPGDNEWADCHEDIAGRFQPLDRLRQIRTMFFAHPGASLGSRSMAVTAQSEDSAFAEYVENVRWRFGGFLFATVHLVGSGNATDSFPGRSAADDEEVIGRTRAALAWLEEIFRMAVDSTANGVVIAQHGDPGLAEDWEPPPSHRAFLDRLAELVKGFDGPVLLIHGDGHELTVDHTLPDRATGQPLANFTRLETYGSPDIGWVRVVVDTAAASFTFEPRLMRPRLFWW